MKYMLNQKGWAGEIAFLGSIGDDKMGETLQKHIKDAGIQDVVYIAEN